jgi:hypothetical protein
MSNTQASRSRSRRRRTHRSAAASPATAAATAAPATAAATAAPAEDPRAIAAAECKTELASRKRMAPDGRKYTRYQFKSFFGDALGAKRWEEAGPPPPPPGCIERARQTGRAKCCNPETDPLGQNCHFVMPTHRGFPFAEMHAEHHVYHKLEDYGYWKEAHNLRDLWNKYYMKKECWKCNTDCRDHENAKIFAYGRASYVASPREGADTPGAKWKRLGD